MCKKREYLKKVTQDSQNDNSFEAVTIFIMFTFDLLEPATYVVYRY